MQIRPVNLDDLTALAVFLAHAGMTATPALLQWKLLNAPGSDRPRSFVAIIDEQIVGHVGVIPATLLHTDRPPVEGGWFVDWLVREDWRGRALGVFLLREAARHWPLLMTLQGSADTREALQLLDWTRIDAASVFKLNLRAGAMNPDLPHWDRLKAELGRLMYYHPIRCPAPAGWTLLPGHGDTSSTLWSQLKQGCHRIQNNRSASPVRFLHDDAFLHHHLANHPEKRYQFLMAADEQGPAAYAIWRLASRPDGLADGRIVDMAAPWDRPDVWRWLVSATTAAITAAGGVQSQCLAAENSHLAQALSANRYLSRQNIPLWLSPSEHETTTATNWHITFADSDIDTAAL